MLAVWQCIRRTLYCSQPNEPPNRARAGDDDKVLRALTDADELEAALLAEKRERDRIAAAAAKEVEALEQKHTRALQEETNRHAADFEECLERHEGEIRR